MKLESTHYLTSLREAGERAAAAEHEGDETWWATEVKPDVFLASAIAARETESIRIGTGIAVAFARTPMTVAVAANDVHQYSGGRFVLGLGPQVKAHITKRFSMPYTHPAPRMREFILAVRAIWEAWATGEKLDFRGDFYTHTLMTPMFDPGPNPHGNPPIHLAAVGPLMTEVAGEVADGITVHALCTSRYLREVTLPAIRRGAERAGRDPAEIEMNAPGFVVIGDSEEERAAGIAATRAQIGFYGSTPAYRAVLELHGWEALGEELERLTKTDRWSELGDAIDDEVLHEFAVIGTPEEVAAELHARYGDVAHRVVVPDFAGGPERRRALRDALAAQVASA